LMVTRFGIALATPQVEAVINLEEQKRMEIVNKLLEASDCINYPKEIRLELTVREPEVIVELCKYPEGTRREVFGLSALRLGVLSLRQACGFIDSATIRAEGERLLSSLESLLTTQSTQMLNGLSQSLRQYFDPSSGALLQRLERLVQKDGELESI